MECYRGKFEEYIAGEGPIFIGNLSWPSLDVFRKMTEKDFDRHLSEWAADQRALAMERAREFLEEYKCIDRFNTMVARHQNGYLLPFVGAGLSIASGYRRWGDFLTSLLADGSHALTDVQAHLARDEFEEAAQRVIDTLTPDTLAEEIHNQMGSHRRNVAGPVCLLPGLFPAEVLTTNFDYVLNHVYANAELPFPKEFKGSQLRQAAQRLGNDPHCLLRLHGEADNTDDRVLTLEEYQAAYADNDGLQSALGNLVGARSLLFLGCSLQTDRTFAAFKAIKAGVNGAAVRHYAFLPFPGEENRHPRRANLGEAEIHPIYYPPEDHDQSIEDLLITMLEGGF
jgi:hypothetical protein